MKTRLEPTNAKKANGHGSLRVRQCRNTELPVHNTRQPGWIHYRIGTEYSGPDQSAAGSRSPSHLDDAEPHRHA